MRPVASLRISEPVGTVRTDSAEVPCIHGTSSAPTCPPSNAYGSASLAPGVGRSTSARRCTSSGAPGRSTVGNALAASEASRRTNVAITADVNDGALDVASAVALLVGSSAVATGTNGALILAFGPSPDGNAVVRYGHRP